MEVHSKVICKSEYSKCACFLQLMLNLVTEKESHSVRCCVFGCDNVFCFFFIDKGQIVDDLNIILCSLPPLLMTFQFLTLMTCNQVKSAPLPVGH